MKKVKICGVTYTIEETEDKFTSDSQHFGEIDYIKAKILINKELSQEHGTETLCHEIVHGILFHLGMYEYNKDEGFVQALGNAIYQSFIPKIEKENENDLH